MFLKPQKKHLHPQIRHVLNGLQGCLRYKCVVLCRAMGDEGDDKKIGMVRSSLGTVRKIELARVEYVSEAFAKFILNPAKYYLVETLEPDKLKAWFNLVFGRDDHDLPEDFDVVTKWIDEQRQWVAQDGPMQDRMEYWRDFDDRDRQLRIYHGFQNAMWEVAKEKLTALCGRPVDPSDGCPLGVSRDRWEEIVARYSLPCWASREFNRKLLLDAFYWYYDLLNEQSKRR